MPNNHSKPLTPEAREAEREAVIAAELKAAKIRLKLAKAATRQNVWEGTSKVFDRSFLPSTYCFYF